MRIAYYAVIVLLGISLVILQFRLWTGKGSMQEVRQLEKEIALQKKENQSLYSRNQALWAEVRDLKQGLESFDERARLEFGMIHKEETFFQIVKPDDEK